MITLLQNYSARYSNKSEEDQRGQSNHSSWSAEHGSADRLNQQKPLEPFGLADNQSTLLPYKQLVIDP